MIKNSANLFIIDFYRFFNKAIMKVTHRDYSFMILIMLNELKWEEQKSKKPHSSHAQNCFLLV